MNDKPVQTYNADHDIYWCDQTDDFDYPDDLNEVLQRYWPKMHEYCRD